MACGRPIVATRVGGIPELVQDGQTGFLVPRDNHRQIAERISALLEDADWRIRLGEVGRSVASARFDLRHNVSLFLDLHGLGQIL
jgi:glycosyltransferase involved in cell wall biosynthesis